MKPSPLGQERLGQPFDDALQNLFEVEDSIWKQELRHCDLDSVNPQRAPERNAVLEHQVHELESPLGSAEILPEERATSEVESSAFVTLVQGLLGK